MFDGAFCYISNTSLKLFWFHTWTQTRFIWAFDSVQNHFE